MRWEEEEPKASPRFPVFPSLRKLGKCNPSCLHSAGHPIPKLFVLLPYSSLFAYLCQKKWGGHVKKVR